MELWPIVVNWNDRISHQSHKRIRQFQLYWIRPTNLWLSSSNSGLKTDKSTVQLIIPFDFLPEYEERVIRYQFQTILIFLKIHFKWIETEDILGILRNNSGLQFVWNVYQIKELKTIVREPNPHQQTSARRTVLHFAIHTMESKSKWKWKETNKNTINK